MLSRPPTNITLTSDDVAIYEQRKLAREAMRQQQAQAAQHAMDSSQNSEQSTVENGSSVGARDEELTSAAQTRAARVRASREQRIGVGGADGRG